MKKQCVIWLLFLFCYKTEAQVVFCPAGAEWHYSFRVEAFTTPWLKWVNETVKYTGDIVVDNETVKVLQHRRFFKKDDNGTGNWSGTLIKQKGDTVFFRNKTTNDKWQILYNFAALPGQSWQNTITVQPAFWTPTVASPITNTYTVVVDSVKNVIVNSFSLKRLYVRYKAIIYQHAWDLVMNTDTVYIDERMGCSQFLLNFYNRIYNPDYREYFNGFLCYSDSVFGTKQITDKPCNYTDYVSLHENSSNSRNIEIYPNPSSGLFTINTNGDLLAGKSVLSIKDIFGRELKQSLINGLNQGPLEVDIADLADGLYLLNLMNGNNTIYTGKLIKSK